MVVERQPTVRVGTSPAGPSGNHGSVPLRSILHGLLPGSGSAPALDRDPYRHLQQKKGICQPRCLDFWYGGARGVRMLDDVDMAVRPANSMSQLHYALVSASVCRSTFHPLQYATVG
jgi:hypothetical protein